MSLFQKQSIRNKLIIMMMIVGTCSILVIGVLGYRSGRKALTQRIAQQLEGTCSSKVNQLHQFFEQVQTQIQILSDNPMVVQAAQEFQTSYDKLSHRNVAKEQHDVLKNYYDTWFLPKLHYNTGSHYKSGAFSPKQKAGQWLQYHYMAHNPYPVGKKEYLLRASTQDNYHDVHAKFHPQLRKIMTKMKYYDILLVGTGAENVVYTVRKETDFATSLRDGPYQKSNLAQVVKLLRKATQKDTVTFVDLKPYAPSHGAPAMFLASPIFAKKKRVGTLVFQIPTGELSRIMTNNLNWVTDGLGRLGESYVVGQDHSMRTNSRFLLEQPKFYFQQLATLSTHQQHQRLARRIQRFNTTILQQHVKNPSVNKALKGWRGMAKETNYLQQPVITAYAPLQIHNLRWAVVSEVSVQEAFQPIREFQQVVVVAVFLLLGLFFLLFTIFAKVFLRPIEGLIEGSRLVGAGHTRVLIQSDSQDEFGELIDSFNEMSQNIHEQTQTIRQKSQEAHNANKTKSDFLANMSHEIRTPMNAIINMANLTLDSDLTPKQQQYVQTIETSSQSLLTLINDILDLSKIEADRMDLEAAEFELRRILEDVTNTFRAKVLEKHVELIVHAELDVPVRFVGDQLRLRQVLVNLIGNAFKFTDQGEVVLKVTLVEGHGWSTPSNKIKEVKLHFSVRDTGIGIPANKLERLFEAFTQADNSTSRKYGGTGLGLTITRRLVNLMGGEIKVTSEEGKGSEFSFTIPMKIDRDQTQTMEIIPPELHHLRTFVVDDSETSRDLFNTFFLSFGMDCTVAASAEEGLELIQQQIDENNAPYDLFLLDWRLPGMDGLEMSQKLRELQADTKTPIILTSAYAGKAEEARAIQQGVDVFLPKPITPSTLFDAVMEAQFKDYALQKKKKKSASRTAGDFRGVPLLVAEDNEANQFVIQEILAPSGFALDIAEDGAQAVEMAKKNEYVLVLMDMQMPVMDGLEATQTLRKQYTTEQLPIVALTANAMKGDLEKCLNAGMDDYVAKPIQRSLLFEALNKWIPEEKRKTWRAKTAIPAPIQQSIETDSPKADIPTLEGIDIQGAMQQLEMTYPSLRKLLLRFGKSMEKTMLQLELAVSEVNVTKIRLHAHSLAGSAGNLGITDLSLVSKQLEKAAQNEAGHYNTLLQQVQASTDIVRKSLTTLQATIEAPVESASTEATKAFDRDAFVALVQQLISSLQDFDATHATQQLEQIRQLPLPQDIQPKVEAMGELIEAFDFEEAEQLAKQLL